jgi:uncharacterized protein YukJ
MEFDVTSGNPTDEELIALKVAMARHKVEVLAPVIKRSVFGAPQLRQPLPHQINFGARKSN